MSLPRDIEGVRVQAEKLAREHAATGGKVVGYVTPCVPAELIEAAGMRPIMLNAGSETSTTLGDRVMESLFDTTVRGVFERLLRGEFDFLAAVIMPRANDSAHRLYYYLSELKRTGEAKLPPVLLCDVVMTPHEASRRYSVDALQRLWGGLRALGDTGASESDLRRAIRDSNRRTNLLNRFVAQRRRAQGAATGAEALATFAAARMLPPDVFESGLAERFNTPMSGVDSRALRVMICGSAHDGAGLHGLIESAGGCVSGDFHSSGELSIGDICDEALPPLEALADRYRADAAASRHFVDPAAAITSFAKVCEAQAAIFSYFAEEEALTWDYPEQRQALELNGLRVLRLRNQTRPFEVEANRRVVEQFVRGGQG